MYNYLLEIHFTVGEISKSEGAGIVGAPQGWCTLDWVSSGGVFVGILLDTRGGDKVFSAKDFRGGDAVDDEGVLS